MRALLDVNVLLALYDHHHMFHAQARGWWSVNVADGWASCPLTQNAFARIMSQPSYPRHRPIAEGAALLSVAINQSGHLFWPDDISIADPAVFDHRRIFGPKQVTDIYLLALAVQNSGRLATFDRSIPITAVRGAEARHLAVL